MNSKKAITLLVLTTMLLSLVPIIPVSADIAITDTYETDGATPLDYGHKGTTISVKGTGVTAGKSVELYWDLVQPWSSSDGAGLLNSTTAKASGAYEIWFDVPEALIGNDHYIWVKDTETGANDFIQFTVNPYVKASSSSGLENDRVELNLYGFDEEEDVAIILGDSATSPSATAVAGETLGTYAGGGAGPWTYSDTLANDMIKNGTLSIDDGTLTTVDQGDGTLTVAGLTGTVNYLTGEITLTWAADPGAVTITATAYQHFANVQDTCYVLSTGVETSDLGSVAKTITVPDVGDMDYGAYHFYAFNAEGKADSKAFAIGAVITTDIEAGPVGSVVEIRGRGFDGETVIDVGVDIINQGDVTLGGVDCYVVDAPITVDSDGDFKIEVVIPQMADEDEYTLQVDTGDETAAVDVDFEVTGLATIELDPQFGVQGSKVTIHGYNFTQISGEEVTIELWPDPVAGGAPLIDSVKTFDVDSKGEFSGTFTVPARSSDVYTFRAKMTDDDYAIEADETFRIGSVIVILTPDNGPTGTLVTMTGTGFTADNEWNATFDGMDLVTDGDVDSDGNLGVGVPPTFYVPTVEPGVYSIVLLDIESEIEVEVEFTVSETSVVTLDPMSAPQNYNVSITGKYFAADGDAGADVSLEFVLYNSTDDWDMDVRTGPDGADVEAFVDDDGNFTAWWDFNGETLDLDIGTYMINVTDGEDLFAQTTLNIVSKTVDIEPRKSVFRIGDTVAFNVESSFAQDDSYIKVWDPSGNLYWRTDAFEATAPNSVWIKVGTIERVPYYEQVAGGNPMTLLDDAPLGTWTWVWYEPGNNPDELDSGTFTVESAETDVIGQQVEDLNNQITDLASQLTDVTSEFDDVKSDIADVAAIAEQAVAAANQAAEAVQTVAQTANTASQAAADAATAAEAARDAANGLTTLVYGAIGAALVAALAAIVSLMQISRRIAG